MSADTKTDGEQGQNHLLDISRPVIHRRRAMYPAWQGSAS